ncbi:SUMF1/EgtB/PvdO family nonheme iron enzyme [Candidatus Poribacteria bacterium]
MRLKSMERIAKYSMVIVILGLLVGCGEDNSSPVIISFMAGTTEVDANAEVGLVVLATDPDGDDLTYTYQCVGAIIRAANMATWVAPDDNGNYMITVYVSDGKLSAQSSVIIAVSHEGMVFIPAGEFEMGDRVGYNDELPVHTVYLDAFYIDKYEVTNAQYALFLNEYGRNNDGNGHKLMDIGDEDCLIIRSGNTYTPKSGYGNHPAVEVSWHGAGAYAQFYGKRLPTEAQWEKAARGGLVGKRYPIGNSISHDDANYEGIGGRDIWRETSPVGSFAPNGYGLYDMAGNVSEWCADVYDYNDGYSLYYGYSYYYSISPKNNPTGPGVAITFENDDFTKVASIRVKRGGSWGSYLNRLRVAYREAASVATNTHGVYGFRCASQD